MIGPKEYICAKIISVVWPFGGDFISLKDGSGLNSMDVGFSPESEKTQQL